MIPVNEPLLDHADLENVMKAVQTGWISSAGEFVDRFEASWAARCGRAHGVAVANGSAALDISIQALKLGPGDEVILPSFTIISCAAAVVRRGATPVLVDADPETWCMDVTQVESRITDRTRAIMPVHIYGHPVDMDPLTALAEGRGLRVVEDAAEAHGALYRDRPCGAFGDLSCFSFYANKIITTGEGGMVVTDDPELAHRLRYLRNLAFEPERRFLHREIAYNYRLTNLQAAVGVGQVERLPQLVEIKRRMGHRYNELLQDCPGIARPVERAWAHNVYWMYGLVLEDDVPFDAQGLADRLRDRHVDTRPFFLGMHEQPVFHGMGLFQNEQYPVTERIASRGLYLPSGMALTDDQLERSAEALNEIMREVYGGGAD